MGGDVVVVRCGAYLSGPFPTIEGGWFGGSVGGDRVVGGSDGHVVRGVMCGTDKRDPFLSAAGVVESFSVMINPLSTNSRIVCRCKNRGVCGCSR